MYACREQEQADAAAEEAELMTNIADANFSVLPEEGEEGDLAATGRRIQVLCSHCCCCLVLGWPRSAVASSLMVRTVQSRSACGDRQPMTVASALAATNQPREFGPF